MDSNLPFRTPSMHLSRWRKFLAVKRVWDGRVLSIESIEDREVVLFQWIEWSCNSRRHPSKENYGISLKLQTRRCTP